MEEFQILRFKSVPSTQDVAAKLAREGVREFTVVVAQEQTRGRGRYGRKWLSPIGGLWFTIILRPKFEATYIPFIGYAMACSIIKTFDALNIKLDIKWPNDIVYNNLKVGGILVESAAIGRKTLYTLVGVGLNINNEIPSEIKNRAISIRNIVGKELDLNKLLVGILEKFREEYQKIPSRIAEIINFYNRRLAIKGKEVEVECNGTKIKGKCIKLDIDGALIVKSKEALIKIYYGEVRKVHIKH